VQLSIFLAALVIFSYRPLPAIISFIQKVAFLNIRKLHFLHLLAKDGESDLPETAACQCLCDPEWQE
jgi:hypothetical protein